MAFLIQEERKSSQASYISNIYRYAGELDAANKYFELKVYQGEPQGFMITESGELSESFVAKNAYKEMIGFFNRTLKKRHLLLYFKKIFVYIYICIQPEIFLIMFCYHFSYS